MDKLIEWELCFFQISRSRWGLSNFSPKKIWILQTCFDWTAWLQSYCRVYSKILARYYCQVHSETRIMLCMYLWVRSLSFGMISTHCQPSHPWCSFASSCASTCLTKWKVHCDFFTQSFYDIQKVLNWEPHVVSIVYLQWFQIRFTKCSKREISSWRYVATFIESRSRYGMMQLNSSGFHTHGFADDKPRSRLLNLYAIAENQIVELGIIWYVTIQFLCNCVSEHSVDTVKKPESSGCSVVCNPLW